MFKFASNCILSALVVSAYVSIAIADLEARQTDESEAVTVCTDFNFGGSCDTLTQVLDGACFNFDGQFAKYNYDVSSAKIPSPYTCYFSRGFECDNRDGSSVPLVSGDYPDFTHLLLRNGSVIDSNDNASSVNCILSDEF